MMLANNFIAILLLCVVAFVNSKPTVEFPTCDALIKTGPILSAPAYEHKYGVWKIKRNMTCLKSGNSVDQLFPDNWSNMELIYPSSLLVTMSSKSDQLMVDLKTGAIQLNQTSMNLIKNALAHCKVHCSITTIVTVHDDLTVVAFDSNTREGIAINGTSGEASTTYRTMAYHMTAPSLSIIDGKYCIIGGREHEALPMTCYDRSKRLWYEDDRIKVKRSHHGSIQYDGVLYVCGGNANDVNLNSCTLYSINNGMPIKDVPIPCGKGNFGKMFTMNNVVYYAHTSGLSPIDPPGKCIDLGRPIRVHVIDKCDQSQPRIFNAASEAVLGLATSLQCLVLFFLN